ncbi:Uncharacterised protein [Klebsiella pneumoniae]|uniref:hypothetical protein n=1 Tax=Klebsiella TaxID=570 RepID=UPI000E2AAB79|nr:MULTISPECIES: hypothetical protein [Klebsiella]SXG88263.1 Uncharacterised protein [Klebsiella pneumoniae]
MSFYLTGNPVPSASMPDVHDNAQNLDFALNEITSTFWTDRLGRRRMSWLGIESAFTMKLTDFESRFDFRLAEQESVFAESLVDKENRFQQFLGDSGYVFLGDYEDGPFQFSARNQYIRFQNQFYRLNKSTDTGFTTTGTDETSFANDVTHLVLMDGDTLRQNLGSDEPGMGDNIITHVPTELGDQITTVNQALSAQAPTIWQYARYITDKPTTFPSTWDWGPAFQAAHDNDNVGPLLINGETYTVRTPVVYEYTDDDYLKYSRLPRCPTGFAIIDYSGLGNGGAGFNDALEVDDAAQPAYVPAFTVKGASGYVVLQEFEGIVFRGNKNTAAIKLIGCDGVRPNRCIFTSNRYGVVFNNGNASGTYAELNAPVFCRWRGGCLTAIAYEKGSGDTSFHGCGLGGDCHVTVTAGRSPVLIGAGCQPYNAPMNANFWMSGVSAPLIQNKGMTAHFYGNLKLEGSFKTVLSAGAKVYFYGPISTWSGVDKGTLTQAVRGGPTGPRAGNLDFSGITEPQITRWDIAAAGSVVAFAGYNEEAVVTVRGSTLSCTFKITTGRHKTDRAVSAPVVVIYGNFNPITRFNIKGTVSGLSLTTAEDNTIIVARRVGGLPDESSGNNFSTADYWRTE